MKLGWKIVLAIGIILTYLILVTAFIFQSQETDYYKIQMLSFCEAQHSSENIIMQLDSSWTRVFDEPCSSYLLEAMTDEE